MDPAMKEMLRFARLPVASAKLRLANYGPELATLAKALMDGGPEAVQGRIAEGRGWVVQGEPVRALEATQALLKALLLSGYSGVYYSGFGTHLMDTDEDGVIACARDVKVWAVGRFYDCTYKTCPYSARERFDTENFLLGMLGRCTPVLHCRGALTSCDWYSDELTAKLLNTCEVVTV